MRASFTTAEMLRMQVSKRRAERIYAAFQRSAERITQRRNSMIKNSVMAATLATSLSICMAAQSAKNNPPAKQAPAKTQTITGYVSDANCGRNVSSDCNKQCISQGAAPVLVVDGSRDVLKTKNGDELKKYPGAHVQVAGVRSGDELAVQKVTPLK
jgi:hypothetical protein